MYATDKRQTHIIAECIAVFHISSNTAITRRKRLSISCYNCLSRDKLLMLHVNGKKSYANAITNGTHRVYECECWHVLMPACVVPKTGNNQQLEILHCLLAVYQSNRLQLDCIIIIQTQYLYRSVSVMWSETIGLRTGPVWDQNNRSWSRSCSSGVVLWNMIL